MQYEPSEYREESGKQDTEEAWRERSERVRCIRSVFAAAVGYARPHWGHQMVTAIRGLAG